MDTLFDEVIGPRRRAMGSHQSAVGGKDEWLTPPHVLEALGPFDLDPCAPITPPWPTAERTFTIAEDGLSRPWEGRVWLNPPYSKAAKWLTKLADYNRGTALIFARTETAIWQRQVWPRAAAILFLEGRLTFFHADGKRASFNAGAPSALVAYGSRDAAILKACTLPGAYIDLEHP